MNTQRLEPGEATQALRAAGIEIIRERTGDGSEIQCRCPHCHVDPDGHLYVNSITGAAFCQKCHLRGNLATLCGHAPRAIPAEELTRLDILAATAAYYHAQFKAARPESDAARALHYLTGERALSAEIAERFQVGWAGGGLGRHLLEEKGFSPDACLSVGVLKRHDDGPVRDFFYLRIIFPNVVAGRVVHLSGRIMGDGEPKWLHLPGEITHPYNADALRRPDCLWVEGILDVLSAEAWGYPAAAGLGTQFKDAWLSYVPEGSRFLVCLDGDRAGAEATLGVATALGTRTRIVTLPQGKDPNDLLRQGRRDEFEACLNAAQNLLTFQINRIPEDTPKTELPGLLHEVLKQIASADPASAEAYLGVIKSRFRLNREEMAAYRSTLKSVRPARQQHDQAGRTAADEATFAAAFDGLVDLVEQDGKPAFLIVEEGRLRVAPTVERGGTLAPPPQDQIPWLLPRADEALRWYGEDEDGRLYDALVAYYQSVSELPCEGHYHLLAAWTLHTYVLEAVQYSPEICLLAVPERGKTRTGKAMTYAAYRGIHVESLRDSYIVRFAANFGGTIFFDVMNLWQKALKEGSEDILLGRFERGIMVPRVNWPERGPHRDTAYYPIFGPTVIGTNDAIHHILDTRAVTITMPQARRCFEADVTPEAARPLRERLVAFRARHLGAALPGISKPAPSRLGDILKPLVQVVRLVRPEREPVLRELVAALQRERLIEKAETLEGELLQALDGLREEVQDGLLAVKAVTKALNVGRPDKNQVTPQLVGRRLRSLGFKKGQRQASGATIVWDEDRLVRAMEAYGLHETAQTAHSTPEAGDSTGASAESAECAESPQGVDPSGAHTPSEADEVAGWPAEWRQAFDERAGTLMDDGIPLEEARRQALEWVRKEFGG